MTNKNEEMSKLSKEFEKWQKLLIALGDENRQHIMIEMMHMEHCGGARVIKIAKKTHLSRPAVSHHIQIL